jgi:hypothetical protein
VHDRYTYLTVGDGRSAAEGVIGEVVAAGGVVIGTWTGAGSVGWWDDEVVLLVGWPEGTTSVLLPGSEALRATARPTIIEPLEAGGIFAHRWFEIDAADWDELLELSTGAWPPFERAYDATIHGFFRSDDDIGGRVLLITRYPSLDAWERSRAAARADDVDVAESGRRFMRRRELTRRSIVRIGQLL